MKKIAGFGVIKKRAVLLLTILTLVVAMSTTAMANTTIRFFHMFWIPGMLDVIEDAIERYERENPGVTIEETRVSWTDAPSQLMTSIVAGEPPDIIYANPAMTAQFRSIGGFVDLTDYLSEEFKNSIIASSLEIITDANGRIDGIPTEGATWALFYRKDLFEAAGLDPNRPPQTIEEFLEAAQALTKDTDGDGRIDQWGFAWPVQAENAVEYWVHFMRLFGSPVVVQENGVWKSVLNEKEALEGTQFMVDLVHKYQVSPASLVDMDWEAVTNGFVFGRFAMMHNGAWVVDAVKDKGPELEGKWGTAEFFAGPAGKVSRGHANTFHILKASRNQDIAWDFLNFFYTEGRKPGLTYAEELPTAAGALLPTESFMTWARANYEPLLQPFLSTLSYATTEPMAPQWQTFKNLFATAEVQNMLLGNADVKTTMEQLHNQLTQLLQY